MRSRKSLKHSPGSLEEKYMLLMAGNSLFRALSLPVKSVEVNDRGMGWAGIL